MAKEMEDVKMAGNLRDRNSKVNLFSVLPQQEHCVSEALQFRPGFLLVRTCPLTVNGTANLSPGFEFPGLAFAGSTPPSGP